MIRKRNPSIATTVSQKEASFLRSHWPKVKNRCELTASFNSEFNHDYTVWQIRGVLWKHKIASGRSGIFQPGHVSWTAGNKGTGRVKRNSTSFMKGNIPANSKALYTERISINGYIEIKVPQKNPYTNAKTRYMQKHIWLWETHQGQIKKGCCVVFVDGDRLNCVLSNLAEINKAENLRRNRAYNSPFRETKKLLYKLQYEVKKAKRRV